MSSRKKEDCDKSINSEHLVEKELVKYHKHGSKTAEVAATDEIRVLESDVKDIIEMMKADLNESVKQEKEEENRGGIRQDTKSGSSSHEHNFELSSLSNSGKPENDEDASSSSATQETTPSVSKDVPSSSSPHEAKNNDHQSDDYAAVGGVNEEELQTSRTKTTTDFPELNEAGDANANSNNMSDSNSPYECIKNLDELRLKNLADDEDARSVDSGPNSAHSLIKNSIKKYASQKAQNEAHAADQADCYDDQASPEIVEFIEKARDFGANALDLSRRNLSFIPRELSQLVDLQYIYLEGNNLTKLPRDFFQVFPYLKWLDLRNNRLNELPSLGLNKQTQLRHLLLENNELKYLPNELGHLRNLTALNITDNPIAYPPIDVINKGFKYVQAFMRAQLGARQPAESYSAQEEARASAEADDYAKRASDELNDDVWATSDEDEPKSTAKSLSRLQRSRSATRYASAAAAGNMPETGLPLSYFRGGSAKLNSATRNLLMTQSIQPSEAEQQNYFLKERLNKAKLNANEISKNALKLLNRRVPLPPNDVSVYKNEKLESAIRTGKVEKYKQSKEKIDAKLQKVNDKKIVDDFRVDLKTKQRKLFSKRLVKGVDYVEPVLKAPFDVNEDYLMVMNNEDRAYYDARLADERMRPLSPDTLWRIEEERRIRDNVLQEKIREYTKKLLDRRTNKSQNPKDDRIQAAKDLRELKAIEKELEQRRMEMQHNLRATTGTLGYRETAKLNSKATLANILKSGNKRP